MTLAIFAILATTIFGSYNMVFTSAEPIQDSITDYEMAQNCLHRMLIDLASLHTDLPPSYKKPDIDDSPADYRVVGDRTYAGSDSFARLRFTSFAHAPFGEKPRSGIAQIVYYVHQVDEKQYVLRRSDSLYPYASVEENARDPVLCENVKSLAFKYYDHEDAVHDIWDSDSDEFGYATPQSIGIELELGDESKAMRFETMVTLPVWRKEQE